MNNIMNKLYTLFVYLFAHLLDEQDLINIYAVDN